MSAQMIKGNTGEFSSPSPYQGEGRREEASLLENAKKLRSDMTDVEQKLWYHLRAKRFVNCKFKRQVPMQRYIADFVCFEKRLIVELDGGQHAAQQDYDKKRDEFFINQGFRVLRFWNNEVVGNLEGVLTTIWDALHTPLPNPSPTRGEGLFKPSTTSSEKNNPVSLEKGEGFFTLTSPSPLVGEGRGEGSL